RSPARDRRANASAAGVDRRRALSLARRAHEGRAPPRRRCRAEPSEARGRKQDLRVPAAGLHLLARDRRGRRRRGGEPRAKVCSRGAKADSRRGGLTTHPGRKRSQTDMTTAERKPLEVGSLPPRGSLAPTSLRPAQGPTRVLVVDDEPAL